MSAGVSNQPTLPAKTTNCRVEVKHQFCWRDERPRFVLQPDVRLDTQRIGQGDDVRNHFAPLPAHAEHPARAVIAVQPDTPQYFTKIRVIAVAIDRLTAVQELHALAQTPPLEKASLERLPRADRTAEDCHGPERCWC